jgi:predicted phosphodiesterase
MKIAIISDIHGNYAALEAVLRDAEQNGVCEYIFIGDYIFDLPRSNDTVRLLMNMKNAHCVKGNKERYMCRLADEDQSTWIHNQMHCVYHTFRGLYPDVFNFLKNLENELLIRPCHGLTIFAAHYLEWFEPIQKHSSGSANFHRRMLKEPFTHERYLSDFSEYINSEPNKRNIEALSADVVLYGHNHLQAHGYSGGTLVINPGSCGFPLDFNTDPAYTILEITQNGLIVHERRVPYDFEGVITQALESEMYADGRIWMDLCFMAMREGRDYFGFFFETAREIAAEKGEAGKFFSNATWCEADKVFSRRFR